MGSSSADSDQASGNSSSNTDDDTEDEVNSIASEDFSEGSEGSRESRQVDDNPNNQGTDSNSSDNRLPEKGRPSHAAAAPPPQALLSKSWVVSKSHEPFYTGGKLAVYPSPSSGQGTTISKLLLPVGGNVALFDPSYGSVEAWVRSKASDAFSSMVDDDDDEDDDDPSHDPDSIVALACAPGIIVTCAHNSILRQYSVTDKPPPNELAGGDEDERPQAARIRLSKVWGKSGHTLPVNVLRFHPLHVFMASGSLDGTVRIWDARGGFATHVFRPVSRSRTGSTDGGGDIGGVRFGVSCVAWDDTQRRGKELIVAIGRDNGSIAVHDLRHPSGAPPLALLHDHVSSVTCLLWHTPPLSQAAAPPLLLSAGRDSVLNLWNNDKCVHTLPVYEQVEGMVLTQEGSVATAGSKGVVRLWNIGNRIDPVSVTTESATTKVHSEPLGYVALQSSPETHELIVATAEHNIHWLDSETLQTNRTMVGHLDDVLDVRVLPPSSEDPEVRSIAVATNSSDIRILDDRTLASQSVLSGHGGTVLCLDASPCGQFLASCGKDKQLRVWDLRRRTCVAVAVGHAEAVGATAFSRQRASYRPPATKHKVKSNADSLAFVVTASVDCTLKRWNLPLSLLQESDTEDWEHRGIIPARSLMASQTVRAHEKDINMVAVAPNDSMIATASQDKTVKLWNASDLTLKATLKGHKRGVWDCQFSPVDRVLATGSGDKTLKLWSLTDYSCVRTFQGHTASVLRVRFLSAGLQLVSSGADGLIKLWTVRTNECEATLDGHSGKVWALDVGQAANGGAASFLASGGSDGRLVFWRDSTAQVAEAKQREQEDAILLDQKLANHMRHREYTDALDIALQRDKPMHVLKVLTAIVETDVSHGRNGVPALQPLVRQWTPERLVQILRYCREWNTRARNCHVALIVVRAVVSTVSLAKLAEMDGVPEVLAGILVYAERHFERLSTLRTNSYLLDFVHASMGSLETEEVEYADWERNSRLVLPPKEVEGRIQVGGLPIVGKSGGSTLVERWSIQRSTAMKSGTDDDSDDQSVVTIDDCSSSDSSAGESEDQ